MRFDKYDIFARLFPAILSSVPFFVLHYFLLSPLLGQFWGELLALKFVSDFTFIMALLFLMMQINRIISKSMFEDRMYKNGLNLPTTNFLLRSDNHFSSQYISKVYKRIKSDFGIKIPSSYSAGKDEATSRRIISEAVDHIRKVVGKGTLLGQHNLEYGFIRNFCGGNILALFVSILNSIIFEWIYPDQKAFIISLVCSFIYLALNLTSKWMVNVVGKSYAKVLIQEYMAT